MEMGIKNIFFVCTGNTCRSVMAAALFEKMLKEEGINSWKVYSAGVAASSFFKIPLFILSLMQEEEIDVSGHHSTQFTDEMLNKADLILVMERIHKNRILKQFPQAKKSDKIFLLKEFAQEGKDLEVADPIGQSREIYKACKKEIKISL
ncbi:low molecular weight protein arginine phosphatase, partial [bacterium]|nr:low molecular weight protein arginine phosphatase [bacterium]